MGCDGLLCFFFLERFSTLSHETRIIFTVLLWLKKKTKRLFFSLSFFFQGEGSLYGYAPFTITFSFLPFYLFQYCMMYSRIDSNVNGFHCFFCMCVLPSIITSVFIGGVLRYICVYLYMFHRKAKSSSFSYELFFYCLKMSDLLQSVRNVTKGNDFFVCACCFQSCAQEQTW